MSLTNWLLLAIVVVLLSMVILQFLIYKLKQKTPDLEANKYNANAFSAIRDVLIASVTKGQLPVALLGIVCIVAVFRVPEKDLITIILKVPQVFKSFGILGWILLLFVMIFSYVSVHKLKLLNAKEKANFEKERERFLKILADHNDSRKSLRKSEETDNK